jgi:hypothetical protein
MSVLLANSYFIAMTAKLEERRVTDRIYDTKQVKLFGECLVRIQSAILGPSPGIPTRLRVVLRFGLYLLTLVHGIVHQLQLSFKQGRIDFIEQFMPFEMQPAPCPNVATVYRVVCAKQRDSDVGTTFEQLPGQRGPSAAFRQVAGVDNECVPVSASYFRSNDPAAGNEKK